MSGQNDNSSGQQSFLLSLITDEKEIKYHIGPMPSAVWAGDAIKLGIRLYKRGTPFKGSVKAYVDIDKPVSAAANILQKNRKAFSKSEIKVPAVSKESDPFSPVIKKFEKLKLIKSLKRRISQRKNLGPRVGFCRKHHISRGEFISTIYKNTTVPGTYKFKYNIAARGRGQGIYKRVVSYSCHVRVKPSLEASGLSVELKDNILNAVFTPRDSYGNYLGPGYSKYLKCEDKLIKVLKISDNMDGSYNLEAEIKDKNIAPINKDKYRKMLFDCLMKKYLGLGLVYTKKG